MCGRFTLTFSIEEVAEILNIKPEIDWTPRYNIAPMQQIPVIVNDGEKHLRLFQWGLVPYWAKDKTIGTKMINARAETIDTKPSFKHCLQLILAEGEHIHTCSIITTSANEMMSPLHDRMPVILDKEKEGVWLDPSMNYTDKLKSLLTSYPSERMEAYEVSTCVNFAKYDTIECTRPVNKQIRLF